MTYIIKNKKISKYLSLDIFDNFIWNKNEKMLIELKLIQLKKLKSFVKIKHSHLTT